MAKYLGPIKWLGGAAILVLLFGLLWTPLSSILFSEETRNSVLILAIPFVAYFVSILLLFVLLIVLAAVRFNGKIQPRTYRGIEYTLVGGIIVGVACLFQPWTLVPYRYGFVMLVASTLGFILWSHVLPGKQNGAALTRQQQIFGLAAAVAIVLALTISAASVNAPVEPYGVRQRIWDTYDQAKKDTLAAEAIGSFQNVEIPFLLVFNLFPASIVYFLTSELVGRVNGKKKQEEPASGVIANTTRA